MKVLVCLKDTDAIVRTSKDATFAAPAADANGKGRAAEKPLVTA